MKQAERLGERSGLFVTGAESNGRLSSRADFGKRHAWLPMKLVAP
jgi:hypothetical protein